MLWFMRVVYVCPCVCVPMYVWMCVCVFIHVCVSVCVHMCVSTCVCSCVSVYPCVSPCMSECVCLCVCPCVCVCMYPYVCVHVYVRPCECLCVSTFAYMEVRGQPWPLFLRMPSGSAWPGGVNPRVLPVCLLSAEISRICYHIWLFKCAFCGSELRSSCLRNKHFSERHLPEPLCGCLGRPR